MTSKKETKQRVKQIIKEEIKNHLLLESVLRELDKIERQIELNEGVINEGIWDSIKYAMAKAAPLQKGTEKNRKWNIKGFRGGADEAQRKAEGVLAKHLEKAGNEIAKKLDDQIKNEYSEYPNMKDQWEFISATTAIAQAYEGVVAGYKKYDTAKPIDKQEESALDSSSANAIIKALRLQVKKSLDYDLADVYKHFTEDRDEEQILETQKLVEEVINEIDWEAEAAKTAEPGSEEEDEKYLSADEESATIAGLKSRILPAVLTGLGGGFAAAHLYAMSLVGSGPKLVQLADLPKDEIKETTESYWTTFAAGVDKEIPPDAKGMLVAFSKAGGGSPQDIVGNIDRIAAETGNSVDQIFSAYAGQAKMGEKSGAMVKAIYEWGKQGGKVGAWNVGSGKIPGRDFIEFVKNTQGADMAKLVAQKGAGAGTGAGGLTNLLARDPAAIIKLRGAVLPMLINVTIKKAVAGSLSVAGLASPAIVALAPAFAAGALAFGLGGGLILYLRKKGLKDSRAAVLQKVWEEMKYLPPHPDVLPPEEPCEDGSPKDFDKYPDTGCPPKEGEDACKDGTPKDFDKYPKTGCPPEETGRVDLPAVAVLDDDAVSVFRIRWRKREKVKDAVDIYKAAQDAAIIGKRSPFTNPRSDAVAKQSREIRPFKADEKTFAQIKKWALSTRGYEPYFSIDASIITDLTGKRKSRSQNIPRPGIDKVKAIKVVKELFALMMKNEKKNTVGVARKLLASVGVKEPMQASLALKWLMLYGLVQSGDVEAGVEEPTGAPSPEGALGGLSDDLANAGADEKTKSFIVKHIATQLGRQGLDLKEAAPAPQSKEREAGRKAGAATRAATTTSAPAVGTPEEEEAALADKEVSGEKKPGTTGEPQIAVYSHPAGSGVKRDLKQALIGAGVKDKKMLQQLLDIVAAWGKSQNLKINENELCEALYKDLLIESTFSRWQKMSGIIKG